MYMGLERSEDKNDKGNKTHAHTHRERAFDHSHFSRAAYMGHTEVVRLLLSSGADRDAIDADGCTPSDKAKSRKHGDCVTLLESYA